MRALPRVSFLEMRNDICMAHLGKPGLVAKPGLGDTFMIDFPFPAVRLGTIWDSLVLRKCIPKKALQRRATHC
jgi:hypothetical protein